MKMTLAFALLIGAIFIAQTAVSSKNNTSTHSERRMSEEKQLWLAMVHEGFARTSRASLKFTFTAKNRNSARQLFMTLSQDYRTQLKRDKNRRLWLIHARSKPHAINFENEQWLGWIEYMLSLAEQHNATFSSWSVHDQRKNKTWSSRDIDLKTLSRLP